MKTREELEEFGGKLTSIRELTENDEKYVELLIDGERVLKILRGSSSQDQMLVDILSDYSQGRDVRFSANITTQHERDFFPVDGWRWFGREQITNRRYVGEIHLDFASYRFTYDEEVDEPINCIHPEGFGIEKI